MWTARARRWALGTFPPRKLLPDRQPAYVSSWVYVFGVASLAALGVALGAGLRSRSAAPTGGTPTRSGTSSTACTCGAWSCSWRCWSSTCGASSGWPPGAAAGRDLDHRRGRLHRLDPGVLHRVPVPAELRLAVDRHQRQGRVQRGRGRRVLQPDELRPDAAVARGAPADPADRADRRAVLLVRKRGVSHPLPAARPRGRAAMRAARKADGRRGAARPSDTTS